MMTPMFFNSRSELSRLMVISLCLLISAAASLPWFTEGTSTSEHLSAYAMRLRSRNHALANSQVGSSESSLYKPKSAKRLEIHARFPDGFVWRPSSTSTTVADCECMPVYLIAACSTQQGRAPPISL